MKLLPAEATRAAMKDLASITERLKVLADGTRLRILHLLRAEELTVGELATALGHGQSTVSSQLARLREAGLVHDRRDGTRSYYRLNPLSLDGTDHVFWKLVLDRLVEDPMFAADRKRLDQTLLARSGGTWVDRAAGSLDRRYIPGRNFESLAVGLAALLELGDCVDMGSGDGALLDLIAPAARALHCIDDHVGMIEAGARRIRAGGFAHARFLKGDMHEPPLEAESADTVLFLQSLQYAADPERAIAAAGRVLRPGGRCLVLTLGEHRDERTILEYGHLHPGFTAKRLRGWLAAAGLVVDRCELSGHDHRQPQLPILLAHAHHPGQGEST
ncbi:MAG: metalloregulator ArsR/SmtB family transcription factor [Planctomycetota bacterium]|nr:metalloregulator ArsR/SmtB family transcription factor [Planctomycetota bacterium]